MIIAKQVNVSNECGSFCPECGNPLDMISSCFRCPIFNCRQLSNDPEGISSPLVSPDSFSLGIAQDYLDWWSDSNLSKLQEALKKE